MMKLKTNKTFTEDPRKKNPKNTDKIEEYNIW